MLTRPKDRKPGPGCEGLVQDGHKPGKPEILRDFPEHGKLREFSGNSVQPQGKI